MIVGTLVKEKEGTKTCGIIIEITECVAHQRVKVLWPDGRKKIYKSTFLEKVEVINES